MGHVNLSGEGQDLAILDRKEARSFRARAQLRVEALVAPLSTGDDVGIAKRPMLRSSPVENSPGEQPKCIFFQTG